MPFSCKSAFASMPPSAGGTQQSRQAADRVYQSLTVVAMLLLLGSLWVF